MTDSDDIEQTDGYIYNYASISDEEKLIYQKLKAGELPPTMLQFTDPTEI